MLNLNIKPKVGTGSMGRQFALNEAKNKNFVNYLLKLVEELERNQKYDAHRKMLRSAETVENDNDETNEDSKENYSRLDKKYRLDKRFRYDKRYRYD